VTFFSSSLRKELTNSFSQNIHGYSIYHYHTTLQQTLSSLHPSLNASSFSTIPSLQAALLAPEVAKALVQTHSRANIHAANGLDRLLIILGLKVENEDLVVVEEGTGTGDEEERGGATVGSIGSAS